MSSGLRARVVTICESSSTTDLIAALEESTILMASSRAQTMKEPSEAIAKEPPV